MSYGTIRILVVDDHPVWRRGVRNLLAAEADFDVIGEASDGEQALRMIRETDPNVVLLDMEMPKMSGVEVAKAVAAEGLTCRILALSSYDDAAYVGGLLLAGASGYLTKDKPPFMIVEAVRAVARGEGRWFVQPTSVSDPAAGLSEREREVLQHLAQGLSNSDIASALFISDNTVRNHLASTYAKLGVTSAREAVAWAWREGFIVSTEK